MPGHVGARRSLPTQHHEDEGPSLMSTSVSSSSTLYEGIAPYENLERDLGTIKTEEEEKEKKGEKSVHTKKRKRTSESNNSVEGLSSPISPSGPVVDAWANEFLKEYLADLKKEMKEKEKTLFTLQNLGDLKHVFKKGSSIRPAYCLPLFNFCHSLSILCTKVNTQTKGQCKVWTEDNLRRLEVFEKMNLPENDLKVLHSKFRWCWVKIPVDDASLAKVAWEQSKSSPKSFYMILRGVKEEYFYDDVTGEKIQICKPILEYSAVH